MPNPAALGRKSWLLGQEVNEVAEKVAKCSERYRKPSLGFGPSLVWLLVSLAFGSETLRIRHYRNPSRKTTKRLRF